MRLNENGTSWEELDLKIGRIYNWKFEDFQE
jgi:hypothetical protein